MEIWLESDGKKWYVWACLEAYAQSITPHRAFLGWFMAGMYSLGSVEWHAGPLELWHQPSKLSDRMLNAKEQN